MHRRYVGGSLRCREPQLTGRVNTRRSSSIGIRTAVPQGFTLLTLAGSTASRPTPRIEVGTKYDTRIAVERVNSHLDTSFGLKKHIIRGLRKMESRCCLALVVMLAMAVGRIQGQLGREDAKPATGRPSEATRSGQRRKLRGSSLSRG
jgi:hypothetical protein